MLVAVAAIVCLTGAYAAVAQQKAPSAVGTYPLNGLSGANEWLNSPPLTAKQLKGKVVVVDFWDYSCINCIRAIPYVRAWADKYKADGLVVIGVHTPEFDIEKQLPNVQKAVKKFNVTFPVALDNDMRVWNAFHNQYWPADYFIDATGKVRFAHFGEGGYDESEKQIQQLLKEANSKVTASGSVNVRGQGAEAAADMNSVRSPETYLGFARAEHFASPEGLKHDALVNYAQPKQLGLNQWGFAGKWTDHEQAAVSAAPGGKIVFRFHARDLHMVLAGTTDGKPVRFKVTVDGHAPGADHGVDVDAQGAGVLHEERLYQLIRQKGSVTDHTFTIEFLDAGAQAFTFTFG
jgi:thiol-disulfide isomerase/thioredoxin